MGGPVSIVGIAGRSGAGKGVAAKALVDLFGFVEINFADELKRIVRRLWPLFDEDTLWGPSELRNKEWPEYGGLSARKACQFIGTELGRELDADVWARIFSTYAQAVSDGGWAYSRTSGLTRDDRAPRYHVVASDLRFPNEARRVDESWWVERPGRSESFGLSASAAAHVSEHSLTGADCAVCLLNDFACRSMFREHVSGMAMLRGFRPPAALAQDVAAPSLPASRVAHPAQAIADYHQMVSNLGTVQARCTALTEELRRERAKHPEA